MFVVGGLVVDTLSRVFDCYMVFMAFQPDSVFFFRSCMVAEMVAALALIAPAFVLLSLGFVRLERLRHPGILDHMRHCAVLYTGLPFLGFALFTSYDEQRIPLEWGLGAASFGAAVWTILLNVVVLYARHRTFLRSC